MKRFVLQRFEDETGVSDVGLVAEGIQFSNGKCVLVWAVELSSVGVYDNIELVDKIHGHDGKTKIVWIDKDR